ncbi:MAG: 3-methyl-2-oxobutanoate hydroxymethyltransferase [Chloroflexota bacterium]|nr:3-methyl-2-oxobutanoate hydroxymethyltransferase [Chloroflexota bacterium]
MNINDIRSYKERGERFAMLTAYDYAMASALDAAGIPLLLVGDTLGIFVQGHCTTLPVTLDDIIYHCRLVVRGARNALVVGDMPFGSYATLDDGIHNAIRVMKEGGAQAVKIEGAKFDLVERLTELGIPVMGHLGLTPQSYHQLGGNKVQARTSEAVDGLVRDARSLERAGAFSVVLEAIPTAAAQLVTAALHIPTIGIGAGPQCDAQVLVSSEMLGLSDGPSPRFAKRYAELRQIISAAARSFADEVSGGSYPDEAHSYNWALR